MTPCPLMLELYATHRPSGEKVGYDSENGESMNGRASPSLRSVQISRLLGDPESASRTSPSGDHDAGNVVGGWDAAKSSASPLPSAGIQ